MAPRWITWGFGLWVNSYEMFLMKHPAMTILPIDKDTLVYGSMDFGNTVYTSNEQFNRIMEECGKRMNLKKHVVGVPDLGLRCLYGPVDMEGHIGRDGRFYLLDCARTFCPATPDETERAR